MTILGRLAALGAVLCVLSPVHAAAQSYPSLAADSHVAAQRAGVMQVTPGRPS